ncbi:MAG: WYL domain-containing protein [Bacteroidales bacterium]|nr:WYL domain-containing protein [Bacteroidales bacterium]
MREQNKVKRLLELLIYLSSGLRYSLSEIADRFQVSERTVFRDIKDLREVGFIIPEPTDGRYYVDKNTPYFREISELLHFSKEEAVLLRNAIHAVSDENLLKRNLARKLYALYDFDRVVDTIVKPQHSANIHELIKAIKYRNKVVLRGYSSANSGELKDRIVEPFDLTTNYVATWAYDEDDRCCKTFKNTRITSVQWLPEPWEHEKEHKALPIDVFRISSDKEIPVRLTLSMRAAELLKEEYPLSEEFIQPVANEKFVFEAKVAGLEGVGRFVMGLCDEVAIEFPESLKEFIQNKAKNILTDRS